MQETMEDPEYTAGAVLCGGMEIRECRDGSEIPDLKTTRNPRIQESHAEREIMLVLAGNTNFILNGKIYSATPGDVFFIDRWMPHQCNYGTIKSDFKHIWIHVHEKRLLGMLYRNFSRRGTYHCLTWEHTAHLLDFLNERWDRALLEAEHSAARREIYAGMARILTEEVAYLFSHPGNETRSKTEQVASWIKNYISMRYGRNASLAELEKLTGYNRFYLTRLFKAEYGMTIGDYINCVRRGFAADALARHVRQKEIAQQLGFHSAAAFWLWRNRDRKR